MEFGDKNFNQSDCSDQPIRIWILIVIIFLAIFAFLTNVFIGVMCFFIIFALVIKYFGRGAFATYLQFGKDGVRIRYTHYPTLLSCEKLEDVQMPWSHVQFDIGGPVEGSEDYWIEIKAYDRRPISLVVPNLRFNTEEEAQSKVDEICRIRMPEQVDNVQQLAAYPSDHST
jgi:hypothetical protein